MSERYLLSVGDARGHFAAVVRLGRLDERGTPHPTGEA